MIFRQICSTSFSWIKCIVQFVYRGMTNNHNPEDKKRKNRNMGLVTPIYEM